MSVEFIKLQPTCQGPTYHRLLIEISIGDTDPVLYREFLTLDIINCLKAANQSKHRQDFEHVYELLEALIPDSEEETKSSAVLQMQNAEKVCQ